MIWPIASSPHFWPTNVQSEWPYRYGKNLSGSLVSCSIVGIFPYSAASRIHVVVLVELGPSDRYSAMPSANQSGGRYCASVCSPLPAFAAREDVVLEGVHHLVREHVLEAAIVAGEVEQHAVTLRFGHAGGALAEIAGDVVLSEVRSRREQHDRLLLAELMVQNPRQPGVRALGHPRRDDRGASAPQDRNR